MSLVALDGTPLSYFGGVLPGCLTAAGTSNTTQAASNDAAIMIGQFFWSDGGTHTLDTTGSSKLGWRTGARTFANAGTVYKVGIATVDTSNGPPARATNVANVITPSVSKTYSSAAPMTANSWNDVAPDTGSLSIASGDLLAFFTQMTTKAGADSIVTATSTQSSINRPTKTNFLSAAYTGVAAVPNCILTASDGTLGWFFGGCVFTTVANARTYNSGSSPNEFGNLYALPFPVKVYGIASVGALSGDVDCVLYSSPLGTPVAEKTTSIDANAILQTSSAQLIALFATPYAARAGQQIGAILKPTSVSNITNNFVTLNSSTHQASYPGGANGYAISRSGGSGAFAAVNSSLDRQEIALIVGAFSQENNQLINSGSLVQ